jgi:predicted TPR repeat methyltransferase
MSEQRPDYRDSHKDPSKGERYDKTAHEAPLRALTWAWEQRVLRRIIETRLAGRQIEYLDFACGTGRITRFIEDQVTSATGVDVSESMLAVARKRTTKANLLLADITRSDVLEGRRFDLITAFRFFPNAQADLRREALSALVQHLADDGCLVFNNHLQSSSLPSHTLRLWARCRGSAPAAGMRMNEVQGLLASSGLRILDTYHWGLIPATDEHAPLPRSWLAAIEDGLSRCRVFRSLAQNVIFVCGR